MIGRRPGETSDHLLFSDGSAQSANETALPQPPDRTPTGQQLTNAPMAQTNRAARSHDACPCRSRAAAGTTAGSAADLRTRRKPRPPTSASRLPQPAFRFSPVMDARPGTAPARALPKRSHPATASARATTQPSDPTAPQAISSRSRRNRDNQPPAGRGLHGGLDAHSRHSTDFGHVPTARAWPCVPHGQNILALRHPRATLLSLWHPGT
jgi:hypothetical protein